MRGLICLGLAVALAAFIYLVVCYRRGSADVATKAQLSLGDAEKAEKLASPRSF